MGTVGTLSPFDEPEWDLALERNPYWERASSRTSPNDLIGAIRFDSGSAQPVEGSTITGATSSDTAIVMSWRLDSGTFAGGDAAGIIYVCGASGVFQDNENLDDDVSGGRSNVATTDGALEGAASFIYDYTAAESDGDPAAHDIVGDVPARISKEIIKTGASDSFELWAGFRSARKLQDSATVTSSSYENFIHIWELEDGTNNASESGITDDNTTDTTNSSPGGTNGGGVFVKVVPTDLTWDDTWQEILSILLRDAARSTADLAENFGRFRCLLRAKVTAGTWWVQAKQGYLGWGSTNFVEKDIVEISDTNWLFYDLGDIKFPLRDEQSLVPLGADFPFTSAEDVNEIELYGYRESGSGNLYVDCLCMIPIDEGFIYVEYPADATTLMLGESPKGAFAATASGVTGITAPAAISPSNYRIPAGDGRLYMVLQQSDGDELGNHITDMYLEYYERWSALRGSE
jgi:hypothetical protein